jgi:hypothetical protein
MELVRFKHPLLLRVKAFGWIPRPAFSGILGGKPA